MEFTTYFLLPDGRLRAGWRLALFIVFFLAAWVIFSGVASLGWRESTIFSGIAMFAGASLATTWLMMRLFEHQPFSRVGLAIERQAGKELTEGLAGGVVLVGAIALVARVAGILEFRPSGVEAPVALLMFLSTTLVFVVSATTEELLFRGYPFQRLVEGSNGLVAIAVSSLLFGILHASNPHATRFSILNTMLAGILLALAYLKTRALWLPIGFHFSWNWMLGLLGLPVSGLEMTSMPWKVVASPEYAWLHGGNYGPEGGLLATAALAVGIGWLLQWRKRKTLSPADDGTQEGF